MVSELSPEVSASRRIGDGGVSARSRVVTRAFFSRASHRASDLETGEWLERVVIFRISAPGAAARIEPPRSVSDTSRRGTFVMLASARRGRRRSRAVGVSLGRRENNNASSRRPRARLEGLPATARGPRRRSFGPSETIEARGRGRKGSTARVTRRRGVSQDVLRSETSLGGRSKRGSRFLVDGPGWYSRRCLTPRLQMEAHLDDVFSTVNVGLIIPLLPVPVIPLKNLTLRHRLRRALLPLAGKREARAGP